MALRKQAHCRKKIKLDLNLTAHPKEVVGD
jgi:hypothetical protein